jgi:hypothetical protein
MALPCTCDDPPVYLAAPFPAARHRSHGHAVYRRAARIYLPYTSRVTAMQPSRPWKMLHGRVSKPKTRSVT